MTPLHSALWEQPQQAVMLPLALLLGMLFIALLTLVLPAGSPAALLWLDHHA